MFSEFYRLPDWSGGFNYKSAAVAAVIVLVCTGAAYLSCYQILKIHPSEALRPATVKTAKPCIFEKLPFWDKLGFTSRYSLRDISRSKLRAVMGIFGTCVGMMVMTLGLGAFDTLGFVRSWYFDDIQNYSSQVILADSCTLDEAQKLSEEYNGELIGTGLISIAASDHPVSDEIISCKLSVTEGKGLFCISGTDLNVEDLKEGTVALTMKQAAKLGLEKGDSVYWKTSDGDKWIKSKIGLISRHPSITGITILRKDYEKEGFEFKPQMLVTKKDCDNAKDLDCVSAVHSMDDLKAALAYHGIISLGQRHYKVVAGSILCCTDYLLMCRIGLDDFRESKGVSKYKICRACNLQQTQLNAYCNNKMSRIDLDVLTRICDFLECDLTDIVKYYPPKKGKNKDER